MRSMYCTYRSLCFYGIQGKEGVLRWKKKKKKIWFTDGLLRINCRISTLYRDVKLPPFLPYIVNVGRCYLTGLTFPVSTSYTHPLMVTLSGMALLARNRDTSSLTP